MHRRMLDPFDQARSRPLDGPRELAVLESVTKLQEGAAQLGAGEVRAQVLADAETDVRVRLAIDPEGEWIGEHGVGIAVALVVFGARDVERRRIEVAFRHWASALRLAPSCKEGWPRLLYGPRAGPAAHSRSPGRAVAIGDAGHEGATEGCFSIHCASPAGQYFSQAYPLVPNGPLSEFHDAFT